ncbi:MAG: RpoL/Rpb11 RNA polymerase subunit family protein [Candidatus Micrarchaeia archaeon]|jgi:DNA-directed RNA polymerase subunit L
MEVKILSNEKGVLEFEMVGLDVAIPELLVAKLNEEKGVEFAGFKKEHPMIGNPKIILKTKKKDPAELVLEKIEEILEEVEAFRKEFKPAKGKKE